MDVTLGDMVTGGLGSGGEWLDSMLKGFSNLKDSLVVRSFPELSGFPTEWRSQVHRESAGEPQTEIFWTADVYPEFDTCN